MLTTRIVQCTISAGNCYRHSDCIVQFSGPTVTVPQNFTMKDLRIVTRKKCTFLERKMEPSLLGLRNDVLVRRSLGQGCLDLPMGNWKWKWKQMHGNVKCKLKWMIMHANGEWQFQDIEQHACGWGESPNQWPFMKNSFMHATTMRC